MGLVLFNTLINDPENQAGHTLSKYIGDRKLVKLLIQQKVATSYLSSPLLQSLFHVLPCFLSLLHWATLSRHFPLYPKF